MLCRKKASPRGEAVRRCLTDEGLTSLHYQFSKEKIALQFFVSFSLTEVEANEEKPAPHPLRFTQHLPPEGKAIKILL